MFVDMFCLPSNAIFKKLLLIMLHHCLGSTGLGPVDGTSLSSPCFAGSLLAPEGFQVNKVL
jgi:hypothetical protein